MRKQTAVLMIARKEKMMNNNSVKIFFENQNQWIKNHLNDNHIEKIREIIDNNLFFKDKLTRRNMQIKDLKDKIESLKKAYLGELSNGDYKPSDECMADIGRLLGFNI